MPYKDSEKQKKYQAEWISARRKLWFTDKCCRECGAKESLELDHCNPNEKFSHRIWSYSWEKIMKEVSKCQVLCQSCHWKKTARDVISMKRKAHGTLEGYGKWHCRCESCKVFRNESPDEYSSGLSVDEAKELVLA